MVHRGVVVAPPSTASIPAIRFQEDETSGFYYDSDGVALSTNATKRLKVTDTYTSITNSFQVNGEIGVSRFTHNNGTSTAHFQDPALNDYYLYYTSTRIGYLVTLNFPPYAGGIDLSSGDTWTTYASFGSGHEVSTDSGESVVAMGTWIYFDYNASAYRVGTVSLIHASSAVNLILRSWDGANFPTDIRFYGLTISYRIIG